MAGPRDQDLRLRVQVSASHDLPLALLILIVQHVMHLVVDHVIAELVALRARELATHVAIARHPARLALIVQFRRKRRSIARLQRGAVPIGARLYARIKYSLPVDTTIVVHDQGRRLLAGGKIQQFTHLNVLITVLTL